MGVPNSLEAVVEIRCGDYHTCGIDELGEVRCWGWNLEGQVDVPTLGQPALGLSLAYEHSCAALKDGTIRCWGPTVFRPPKHHRDFCVEAGR